MKTLTCGRFAPSLVAVGLWLGGVALSPAFAANFWQPLCPDGGLCSSNVGGFVKNGQSLISFTGPAGPQRQWVSLANFTGTAAGYICNGLVLPSSHCYFGGAIGGSVYDSGGNLLYTFNPRGLDPLTYLEMRVMELFSLYFAGTTPPTIVSGVGGGGGTWIYLTRDEGLTWERQSPNVLMWNSTADGRAKTNFAISPDGQRIWVVPGLPAPGLWQTPLPGDTGGQLDFTRLARVDDGSFPLDVLRLLILPTSAGAPGGYIVALGQNGLFVSTDLGRSWTTSGFSGAVDAFVFPYAGNPDVQAIAARGSVFVSRDRGRTWSELANGLPSARYELSADNGTLVAAGDGSFVCRALDCDGAGFARVIPFGTSFTLVTEFYNVALDHFFITGDDFEKYFVRNGAAGGWTETGQSFWTWSQGWARESAYVCRFYGDPVLGPNSHFYSASTNGCRNLLDLQNRTPITQPRWNSEGYAFKVSLPDAGRQCPGSTLPVFRAYNDGFARGIDGNHRYVLDSSLLTPLLALGWKSEGIAFCVPPAGHE
jgi:hypothetical protein